MNNFVGKISEIIKAGFSGDRPPVLTKATQEEHDEEDAPGSMTDETRLNLLRMMAEDFRTEQGLMHDQNAIGYVQEDAAAKPTLFAFVYPENCKFTNGVAAAAAFIARAPTVIIELVKENLYLRRKVEKLKLQIAASAAK
jgi:hypothetical protein